MHAKPSKEELALAPHRLIDILDPAESYSAMNFVRCAQRMADITAQGKIPLWLAARCLYYKALIEGLSPLPSADEKFTLRNWKKKRKNLAGQLSSRITKIDPISAERINPNDSQRINRALEVFYLTGKSLTELTEQKAKNCLINFTIRDCTRRSCGITSTYRTTFP